METHRIIRGFFTLVLASLFIFFSCKKDNSIEEPTKVADPIDTNSYGAISVSFSNVVGSRVLTLNDSAYSNQSGEKFNIYKYAYYISNVRLHATDGNVYTEEESYHLINASDSTTLSFVLNNVIVKTYSSITFVIGVDSLRNVSGAQTGDLDPIHNMFWTWSSGYIMAKLEGYSEYSSAPGQQIAYHIAGFSGVNNVLKTVNLPFPSTADVTKTTIPQIVVQSDVLEWFQSPSVISFVTLPSVLSTSANAKMISDNYQDMFTVTQVVN